MIRVEKEYKEKPYTSKAFDLYFGGLSLAVLDIETTGLSPQRANFILGGLSTYDNQSGSRKLIQLFAEEKSEEKLLLKEYLAEISKHDILITYNGKHFDLNFLRRRLDLCGLDFKELTGFTDFPYNLDLYLVLNGYSPLRKLLPNLKQKSVEDFFGLWSLRHDEISGGESAELYTRYLSCKAQEKRSSSTAETAESAKAAKVTEIARLRDLMLLHNADDVMQLGRLVKSIEKSDFHKAMQKLGFPAGKNAELLVSSIEFGRDYLKISGKQRKIPKDYAAYPGNDREFFVLFDSASTTFEVSLPLRRQAGLAFVDLTKIWRDGESNSGKPNGSKCPWEALTRYPRCQSGFLVLQQASQTYYLETNHFVKLLLNDLPFVKL